MWGEAFIEELSRQIREARRQRLEAERRGDSSGVSALQGRIEDLVELAQRHGLDSSLAAV